MTNVFYWERYRAKVSLKFINKLWWKFMPGTIIKVKWPRGAIVYDTDPGWVLQSADPNDHYRPWLERHVGRQGWDWDWRIGQVATTNGERDTIRIKIIFILGLA